MKIIIFLGLIVPFLLVNPSVALEQKDTPIITISGKGTASIKPDMARLNLSVLTNGATAKDALQKNSELMQKVNSIAKTYGIDSKDLSTTQISVNPHYIVENNTSKQRGFEARNVLQIQIRDLMKIGSLIDDSTSAGANGVDSLTFELSNPNIAKQLAYKAAVEDAMIKAKTITDALNTKLGEVIEITEGHESPHPMMRSAPMAMMAEARDKKIDVPIEAGEVEHSASVTIIWKLKQ